MRLEGLVLADEPATWRALGFAVHESVVRVGGVGIRLAGRDAGEGILGWHVAGLAGDVLPACGPVTAGREEAHPNGAVALDHVVAFTGDLEATTTALAAAGLAPHRVRDVPGRAVRQAFYVLETALLELVGPVEGEAAPRFWGLTLVVADLQALGALLGEDLGAARDAVQPGRRIATLRREAGATVPLAFMSPR